MLERDIEKVLVAEIRKLGGRAYKFVSPGNDGVPDRIVFFPDGKVVFVELKTDVGKMTALQRIQCSQIRDLHQTVMVLYGIGDVANFFEEFGQKDTAERIRRRYDL